MDSATPRDPTRVSRKQDSEGNVTACDAAYLQMFGYRAEGEVVGQPTFDRVHPNDQARLIESWIAMVATGRVQMSRVRVEGRAGSWLWVDTTYHNYLEDEADGYVLAECIDVSAEMAAKGGASGSGRRLGGDEFLVLLRHVTGLSDALGAAERISELLCGSYELSCGHVELDASLGVACVGDGRAARGN